MTFDYDKLMRIISFIHQPDVIKKFFNA